MREWSDQKTSTVGQIVYAAIAFAALFPMLFLVYQYSAKIQPLSQVAIMIAVGALLYGAQFQRRFKTVKPPRSFTMGRLPLDDDAASRAKRLKSYLFDSIIVGVGLAIFLALGSWIADRDTFTGARFLGLVGGTAWAAIIALAIVVGSLVASVMTIFIGEGAIVDRRQLIAELAERRAQASEEERAEAAREAWFAKSAERDAEWAQREAELAEREAKLMARETAQRTTPEGTDQA